jgi:hypothetical protein
LTNYQIIRSGKEFEINREFSEESSSGF